MDENPYRSPESVPIKPGRTAGKPGVLLFTAIWLFLLMITSAIIGGAFAFTIALASGWQSHTGSGGAHPIYGVVFYGFIIGGFFAPLILYGLMQPDSKGIGD